MTVTEWSTTDIYATTVYIHNVLQLYFDEAIDISFMSLTTYTTSLKSLGRH